MTLGLGVTVLQIYALFFVCLCCPLCTDHSFFFLKKIYATLALISLIICDDSYANADG